jgi:hypothetical protein
VHLIQGLPVVAEHERVGEDVVLLHLLEIPDSRFRVFGLGFRIQGSGFMVQGLGFRV